MSFDNEDRVRLVDEFAHAVRSRLAVSSAWLELVRTAPTPMQDGDELLETAARNLAAAQQTLERLVDVARRPCDAPPVAVRIGEVIRRIVSAAHADAAARQVAIDATIADGATIVGDQHLLQLALESVIDAAISAAGSPGTVTIDLAAGSGRATLSIAPWPDTSPDPSPTRTSLHLLAALGAGVSFAGDGPAAERAIRIELPDGHAGRIETASDETIAGWDGPILLPGEGSSPNGEAEAEDERPLVLIVEDDDEMRGFLERALSSDLRVVATASAEDAYRAASRVQPDVVVCDIVLPGDTGEQLVHRLRDDPQFVGTPIIVVTGRSDDDLCVRLLHEGANDYITKPFILAELRARIGNQIANRLDIADLKFRVDEAQRLARQLQHALDSRVVIEQAKAFLAAEHGTDLDVAFESLRSYARANRIKIHDVARRVVRDGLRW